MEGPLAETTTMLTDYLLAAFTVAWGGILWRRSKATGILAMRWWAAGFYAIAVASLLGGTVHGYRPILDATIERAMWTGTMWSIGVFALCAVGTAARATMVPRDRRRAVTTATIVLAGYLAWTFFRDAFVWAIVAYGTGMAILVWRMILARQRGDQPAAAWILAGVAVAIAGSAIQQARLAPHPWFNHNDLYHVIQIVAAGLFYGGGRLLTDRRSSDDGTSGRGTTG